MAKYSLFEFFDIFFETPFHDMEHFKVLGVTFPLVNIRD
jgi:hypothetical protein